MAKDSKHSRGLCLICLLIAPLASFAVRFFSEVEDAGGIATYTAGDSSEAAHPFEKPLKKLIQEYFKEQEEKVKDFLDQFISGKTAGEFSVLDSVRGREELQHLWAKNEDKNGQRYEGVDGQLPHDLQLTMSKLVQNSLPVVVQHPWAKNEDKNGQTYEGVDGQLPHDLQLTMGKLVQNSLPVVVDNAGDVNTNTFGVSSEVAPDLIQQHVHDFIRRYFEAHEKHVGDKVLHFIKGNRMIGEFAVLHEDAGGKELRTFWAKGDGELPAELQGTLGELIQKTMLIETR